MTRLGAVLAVLLFTDVGLVTGLTTAGFLEAVLALLGLLPVGESTVAGLDLSALDVL